MTGNAFLPKIFLTTVTKSLLSLNAFTLKPIWTWVLAAESSPPPPVGVGHLSAFRLVLEIGGGADLGLYILQVGQGLIDDLQLPLDGGRGLGRGPDHRHFLLLEDAEGLGRVAAGGAGAGGAAGVAGRRAGSDGGARGGGSAADGAGPCRFCAFRGEEMENGEKGTGTRREIQ